MNKLKLLWSTALLLILSGCISIFADRKVYVEDKTPFSGILDTQDTCVNIFITHGMGTQADSFDVPLIEGLFKAMKAPKPDTLVDTTFLVNIPDSIMATYRVLKSPKLNKTFRIFSLNWSRFNQPIRDYFIMPDGEGGIDYDKRRNKEIRAIKKRVMTDGVIDLIRYTDPDIQEELQGAIYNTIARMFLKEPMVPNEQVKGDIGDPSKRQ